MNDTPYLTRTEVTAEEWCRRTGDTIDAVYSRRQRSVWPRRDRMFEAEGRRPMGKPHRGRRVGIEKPAAKRRGRKPRSIIVSTVGKPDFDRAAELLVPLFVAFMERRWAEEDRDEREA